MNPAINFKKPGRPSRITRGKNNIVKMLLRGQPEKAALIIYNIHRVKEVHEDMRKAGPLRDFTYREGKEILTFCESIGFDPETVWNEVE